MDDFCSRSVVFCFGLGSWLVTVLLNVSFGSLIGGVLLIDFASLLGFSSWLVTVLLSFSFGSLIEGVLLIGGALLIRVATLLAFVVFEVLVSFDCKVKFFVFISRLEVFRFERLTAITVGTKMIAATGIIIAYSSPGDPI